jgi:cytoskeletal protein CcmA (bactofilin family)
VALQSPFFGKRENEPLTPRTTAPQPSPSASSFAPSTSNGHPGVRTVPEPGPSATASAAAAPTAADKTLAQEPGSKLIVGPNIKLKGVEITDCDTLVVEGTVEATMDSRVMQIAEQGAFNGSAEIDIAEIHGTFDGDLVVRDKLVIFATGKVTGKIRYGKIVIEEGGQLSGEIVFGTGLTAKGAGKPAPAAT